MTIVQAIGVVIIRFWAAQMFVRALLGLRHSYYELLQAAGVLSGEPQGYMLFAYSYLADFILGLILFALAKPAVRLLMPKGGDPSGPSAEKASQVIFAGTALIGFYYLVLYLPYLLGVALIQMRLETRSAVSYYYLETLIASVIVVPALLLLVRIRHIKELRSRVNMFILKKFSPATEKSQEANK